MTVTDFTAQASDCNALVAVAIDADGFWDLVLDAYGRVAAALGPAGVSPP
jgi:purine nucleosidase